MATFSFYFSVEKEQMFAAQVRICSKQVFGRALTNASAGFFIIPQVQRFVKRFSANKLKK